VNIQYFSLGGMSLQVAVGLHAMLSNGSFPVLVWGALVMGIGLLQTARWIDQPPPWWSYR
jgi:hypothetical protein